MSFEATGVLSRLYSEVGSTFMPRSVSGPVDATARTGTWDHIGAH